VSAKAGTHEPRPAIPREFASKEFPLTAELLCLRVHVIHELVNQGDRNLFDLTFGVGDLAYEDIASGINAAFGVSVEHELSRELIQGDIVLDVFGDDVPILGRNCL
jgi:hypothetical protein